MTMTSNMPNYPGGRIPVLDGFRGLAILMVTFYRFAEVSLTSDVIGSLPSKAIWVGASGVDFFFVLSGFLITGILLDSKQNPRSYFRRFYFRRTLRIFPLYFATLFVLLFLLPGLFHNESVTQAVHGDQLHLWVYTMNLNIAWLNDWAYGPLNHFWSLAIEEQFYLAWPVVVYYIATKKLFRLCVALLIFLAAARIGFSFAGLGEVTEKTFTLFRLDGLLLGALAAVGVRQFDSLWHHRRALQFCFWGLLILYGLSLLAGKNDFTVRYTLISGVAVSLLLMALTSPASSLEGKLLECGPLRSLGKYSYAMYVFQLPLISLLEGWISPELLAVKIGQPLVSGLIYVAVMFGITYGLAYLSWHCFEKWFLKLRETPYLANPG